jgi:4-hydroxybenzoate polyprenyltransferase
MNQYSNGNAPLANGQPGSEQRSSTGVPLLVDLEDGLLRTDLLIESVLAYVAANPLRLAHPVALWAWQGRAHLAKKLAEAGDPDPELIPVNDEIVALAAEAKRQGRQVFLVTAGQEHLARKLAQRFPFIDDVVTAGDAGDRQGRQVVEQHFPNGYEYIGSSTVGQNQRGSRLRALIKAARLHQLAKNTLIFVPAVLSGAIVEPATLIKCVLAFLALGLIAIGTYLVNDILDLTHDRRHWSKRYRPIASGDLPVGSALAAAAISIGGGLAIGAAISAGVLTGLAAYLALTLAYSMRIKRLAILDVVVLAILFTLRLAIGIAAAQVYASPWLLVFSMSLFTSLSIAKRYTEIKRTETRGEATVAGRGYITADAPLVLGLGLATGTASVLILVLYLIFDAFNHEFYGNSNWLWLFPLVLFLWIARVWLISQRGELNDDPVAFALKDRQSLALGALMVAAFVLAWIGVPL